MARESRAPVANENETKWLSRPCRASTCAVWKARALSRCTLTWCTVAPSATSTSVTALVQYEAVPSATWLSTTATLECRSAATSTRACEAVRAAVASVTKSRWTGRSASISLRTTTSAPSANTAWLSATNGCASGPATRPNIRSRSSGSCSSASAHGSARTPSGSAARDESRSSKRPLTKTSVGHASAPAPNANEASASRPSTSPVAPAVPA